MSEVRHVPEYFIHTHKRWQAQKYTSRLVAVHEKHIQAVKRWNTVGHKRAWYPALMSNLVCLIRQRNNYIFSLERDFFIPLLFPVTWNFLLLWKQRRECHSNPQLASISHQWHFLLLRRHWWQCSFRRQRDRLLPSYLGRHLILGWILAIFFLSINRNDISCFCWDKYEVVAVRDRHFT